MFEDGVRLVNLCNKKLENIESSIKKLANIDGEIIEEDFLTDENWIWKITCRKL